MPLSVCSKFQINEVIVILFSGVWDNNPTPVAENRVNLSYRYIDDLISSNNTRLKKYISDIYLK